MYIQHANYVLYTQCTYSYISTIKTHGSESRDQKKQHAHTSSSLRDHYSESFTWMAALKF